MLPGRVGWGRQTRFCPQLSTPLLCPVWPFLEQGWLKRVLIPEQPYFSGFSLILKSINKDNQQFSRIWWTVNWQMSPTPHAGLLLTGWVDHTSGYVYLHHHSEIGLWTSAGVWLIKWTPSVTSRALHPPTQHPLSFSVISVLQYCLFIIVNSKTKPILMMCSVLFT